MKKETTLRPSAETLRVIRTGAKNSAEFINTTRGIMQAVFIYGFKNDHLDKYGGIEQRKKAYDCITNMEDVLSRCVMCSEQKDPNSGFQYLCGILNIHQGTQHFIEEIFKVAFFHQYDYKHNSINSVEINLVLKLYDWYMQLISLVQEDYDTFLNRGRI